MAHSPNAPDLYFQEGGVAQQILAGCRRAQKPFRPSVWAANPHIQSAMGVLRTLSARGTYSRQVVLATDGGSLGLDWWCHSDRPEFGQPDTPVVLFIHGINGGSHEGYVKWACASAVRRGWRAVALNLRGCNGLPLTSGRGYNAIQTPDINVAVTSIHARFPAAPLLAAGYSLGSVLLTKYLAEADLGLFDDDPRADAQAAQPPQESGRLGADPSAGRAERVASNASASSSGGLVGGGGGGGDGAPRRRGSGLVAAALVSSPVCILATNLKLSRATQFEFVYNLAVAYKLREYVRAHIHEIVASGGKLADFEEMLATWTVARFDEYVTLKDLGFTTPAEYYRHACCTNYIPHIGTPALYLVARDDPFLGVLPDKWVAGNPFTALMATNRGGHLGFLQGLWPLGPSYMEGAVTDFFGSALALARATPGDGWAARARALGVALPPSLRSPRAQRDALASLASARCSCLPEEEAEAQQQEERLMPDAARVSLVAPGGDGSGAAAAPGVVAGGAAASGWQRLKLFSRM